MIGLVVAGVGLLGQLGEVPLVCQLDVATEVRGAVAAPAAAVALPGRAAARARPQAESMPALPAHVR